MGRFTLEQRWEILKCYFQSDCCVAETKRRLEESFGKGKAPTAPAIRKFVKKVRETGMLIDYKNYPRTCPIRSAEKIAAVAKSVQENPNTSLRTRCHQLNISRSTLRRILHNDLGLSAYKVQPGPQEDSMENDNPDDNLDDTYEELEMLEETLDEGSDFGSELDTPHE